MTSLLVLSHSRKVAEAVRELAIELNSNLSVYAVGGAKDGSAGADYDGMMENIRMAIEHGQVIVLFDLGSTMLTIQTVIDELSDDERSKVFLSDAALVEGTIAASVCLNADMPTEEIIDELRALSLSKFD